MTPENRVAVLGSIVAISVHRVLVVAMVACAWGVMANSVHAQEVTLGPTTVINPNGVTNGTGSSFEFRGGNQRDGSGGYRNGRDGRRGGVTIPPDMQRYAAMHHPAVIAHRESVRERLRTQTVEAQSQLADAQRVVEDLTGSLLSAFTAVGTRDGQDTSATDKRLAPGAREPASLTRIAPVLYGIAQLERVFRSSAELEGRRREVQRMHDAIAQLAATVPVGRQVNYVAAFVNGVFSHVSIARGGPAIYPADVTLIRGSLRGTQGAVRTQEAEDK